MAKGMYIGVSGVARKCKKAYIGVAGMARKIKKMYIGIDGVARLCFSAGLSYAGTTTDLSVARYDIVSGNVGNYVLFIGGYASGSIQSAIEAYNSSLTQTVLTSYKRNEHAVASIGNYVISAGGRNTNGEALSTVHAYDTSLTRTTITSLQQERYGIQGGQNSGIAFIGCGIKYSSSGNAGQGDYLDWYNSSLTHYYSTMPSTAESRVSDQSGMATIGNTIIMAGGYSYSASTYLATVYGWNASGTRSTLTSLSTARRYLSGANNSNYAIFAGGIDASVSYSTVEAYDSSLTKYTAGALSSARTEMASASTTNNAIFFGGSGSNAIEYYDKNLVKNSDLTMASSKSYHTAASIDNKVLVAGGYISSIGPTANVEVYEF